MIRYSLKYNAKQATFLKITEYMSETWPKTAFLLEITEPMSVILETTYPCSFLLKKQHQFAIKLMPKVFPLNFNAYLRANRLKKLSIGR